MYFFEFGIVYKYIIYNNFIFKIHYFKVSKFLLPINQKNFKLIHPIYNILIDIYKLRL